MKNPPYSFRLLAATALVFGVFAMSVASAANDTWTGGSATFSTNWNTANNWSPASAPTAGDFLIFGTAGSGGANLTNDIPAGTSFVAITFNSGASAFTFGGNNVTLTGGITNSSGTAQTINFSITNGANITINDGGGGTTLNGAILGTGAITNVGSGTLTLTNGNNDTFSGGITINNGAVLARGGSGSGGNGNSSLGKGGDIIVNAGGTLIGGNGDAFGYGNGNNPHNIYINGGTVTKFATNTLFAATNFGVTIGQNLFFTGGTLTNPADPGNSSSGNYITIGSNITSFASSTTAIIGATKIKVNAKPLTFNIAKGTAPGGVDMLVSSVLINSAAIIKTGAGTLAFSGASTWTGNLTNFNGVVALTGSAVLPASIIAITNGTTFDVSQLSSPFTLAAGKILGGNGVVTGSVVAAANSVIDAGIYGGRTFGFSNALTLNGMTNKFILSGTPSGANSKITVIGNLTTSGANTISISGFSSLQSGTYPLITYGSETAGGTWNLAGFISSGRPGSQTANIVDTGSEIDLVVVGSPANLTWVGDGSANAWDESTTSNWLNGASMDKFYDGDLVRFDDSSTNPTVNLVGTLQPGAILVTNNSLNYIFADSGSGKISGPTSLVKKGTGTLTLTESTGDDFSGGIIVSNGTLVLANAFSLISGGLTIASGATAQISTNDTVGNLPSGALVDNGTLAFDRSDNPFVVSTIISGAGGVSQLSSGTLTLSGANTYAGNVVVSNGTLIDGNRAATDGSAGGLGNSTGGGRTITIASGATLSGTVQNWFGGTLLADANFPSITINGGTMTSTRYTAIGSVTLNNGATLTQTGGNGSPPDPANYQGYQFRGSVTVGGSSASTISSGNGTNNCLGANTIFNVADVTGDSAADLIVSTGLRDQSGDYTNATGGFTKTGAGTMLLAANNPYTGNTIISTGTLALTNAASISNSASITIAGGATLDVSGLSSPFALGSKQTLSNSTSTAVINGSADVSAGTNSLTYSSGTPSLTVTNGNLTLALGTVFKISTSSALGAGSYKIISKATTGNVGSVVGTAPSSVTVGGSGLAAGATASLQITGSSELDLVVSSPSIPHFTSISVSGTTLMISATNGAAGSQYKLLQSTNVVLPLAQWAPVLTNNFDGNGAINLSTNVVNPANAQNFYILLQ